MFSMMNRALDRLGRSRMLSPKAFYYACASSGLVCLALCVTGCAAGGFIPPIAASLTAEETAKHYQEHQEGIKACAALVVIAGMFYLPMTAAISAQMQRIPGIHPCAPLLQLASGATSAFTILLCGMVVGVANFRPYRNIEITEALNDMWWITMLLPWPPFMVQSFAFAYAIIADPRPDPPFPKYTALVNVIAPILFVPSTAVHCTKTGPFAWNGALAFWLMLVSFAVQWIVNTIHLLHDVLTGESQTGEGQDRKPNRSFI